MFLGRPGLRIWLSLNHNLWVNSIYALSFLLIKLQLFLLHEEIDEFSIPSIVFGGLHFVLLLLLLVVFCMISIVLALDNKA